MKKMKIKLPIAITILAMTVSASAQDYTAEDREALAHLIMGEAEGGSMELKMDVGSVVLNRVADSRFPNTISEVIFQPMQYSCTWDGRYNLTPNDECYEAADKLLEEGSVLPEDIIWQAEFKQGSYIYKNYENTYFCGG